MATRHSIAVVDSSALISLANIADSLHQQALEVDRVLTENDWVVLVPQEVFAETVNAIGKKIGRTQALQFSRELLRRYDAHDIELISADRAAYDTVLGYLNRGTSNPSFVDCLVMALADAHQTGTVFGFDSAFHKNGFTLPTAAGELRTAA